MNRVAASRLQHIADVLKINVTFFFSNPSGGSRRNDTDTIDAGMNYLRTSGSVRLVRAYSKIGDPTMRRALLDLV